VSAIRRSLDASNASMRSALGEAFTRAVRTARRELRRPARLARRTILPRIIPPAPPFAGVPRPQANVVGLLSSASGIGKSGRLCIEKLGRAGYGVSACDVARLFACDDDVAYPHGDGHSCDLGAFGIYHLNPPMLLAGVLRSGLSRYYRSYNVGYWAWELERLPAEWIACIRFMHAIMVPSRFCQSVVARYTDKPVLVVPHPVELIGPESMAGHVANDVFRVVNIFRFGSSFTRKNPLSLIEAFVRAFADDAAARLVLKTSDGMRYPTELARLRAAIGDRRNIELIDEVWPEDQVARLLRSAGVYASLHRSEGFGLPLAEAMMAGIPVVATDWSGNTDFCHADNSFPVDYRLVPFGDNHGDYDGVKDARWAEPSAPHAAAQLRRVRDEPSAARHMAEHARRALRRHITAHGYVSALATLAERASAAAGTPSPSSAWGGA
jgi:glycosyltransferase involved in cell wall biosynthesis